MVGEFFWAIVTEHSVIGHFSYLHLEEEERAEILFEEFGYRPREKKIILL